MVVIVGTCPLCGDRDVVLNGYKRLICSECTDSLYKSLKEENEDDIVPIYGAPAGPVITKNQKVKDWNKEYGLNAMKDILFVKKLKQSGFYESQIERILQVIEKTCTHCWDGSDTCCCIKDE